MDTWTAALCCIILALAGSVTTEDFAMPRFFDKKNRKSPIEKYHAVALTLFSVQFTHRSK